MTNTNNSSQSSFVSAPFLAKHPSPSTIGGNAVKIAETFRGGKREKKQTGGQQATVAATCSGLKSGSAVRVSFGGNSAWVLFT